MLRALEGQDRATGKGSKQLPSRVANPRVSHGLYSVPSLATRFPLVSAAAEH